MTAIVLPDIDRATLEDLKSRIPSLSEIELPRMEQLGRKVDETLDRATGRNRMSPIPWLAAGLGLVALAGIVAAFLTTSGRRMPWRRDDRWMDDLSGSGASSGLGDFDPAATDVTIGVASYGTTETGMGGTGIGTYGTGLTGSTGTDDAGTGLTAAEASLMSNDPADTSRGL